MWQARVEQAANAKHALARLETWLVHSASEQNYGRDGLRRLLPTRSRFCCPAGVRRGRGTAGESMRRRNDGRSMRRAKWLGGCCTGTEQIF